MNANRCLVEHAAAHFKFSLRHSEIRGYVYCEDQRLLLFRAIENRGVGCEGRRCVVVGRSLRAANNGYAAEDAGKPRYWFVPGLQALDELNNVKDVSKI